MRIVWTEIQWLAPGLIILGLLAIALFFSYRRNTGMAVRWRWLAGSLKWLGFALLLLFLLRPEMVTTYNQPGTNHWAILLDTSASMTLADGEEGASREEILRNLMRPEAGTWQQILEEEFLVDRFTFDARTVKQTGNLDLIFDGKKSLLGKALGDIRDRYHGRPLAGILVITDGSPTDAEALRGDMQNLPPVFPLLVGGEEKLVDLALANLTAQATLFEDAPVMVDATVKASGLAGETVSVRIREPKGELLAEKSHRFSKDEDTAVISFQVRPEAPGTSFFEVEVSRKVTDGKVPEATLENNRRMVAANRETGPYRVLYLGGRPNYEHKFLQRAIEDDPEVSITSLLRIARREPKFTYKSRSGERSNPLYRGYEEQEEAERFDEPVFIRLNTKNKEELAAGFPKTEAELFPFDAIVIDDVEADFFDRDQQRLLQRYVSERGGSILMLGGMESLEAGEYADTTIGDLLPVYLKGDGKERRPLRGRLRFTREGLLEPWARLRLTEDEERQRLARMPFFQNVHRLGAPRPGSLEVSKLKVANGEIPALVTRRYGRGRTAVIAMTDLWRWGLRDPDSHADLDKSWRQMLRWLLADVPRPLLIESEQAEDSSRILKAQLLGDDFQPDDSAKVSVRVRKPDDSWTSVFLRPDQAEAGVSSISYLSGLSGAYLAKANASPGKGKPSLSATTGWVVNAIQDEYLNMQPDLPTMQGLAASTGGQILTKKTLQSFVSNLENLPLPVSATRSEPLWHSAWWMLAAFACFVGEWSLRRWKKLP